MIRRYLDLFMHKVLRQPYKLRVVYDSGVKRQPIVFLHGIASSSLTWRNVLPLVDEQYRVICLDLLGFGASPKPDWSLYDVGTHAKAAARTIRSLHLRQPVVLVGHSMGSLVAVEIATRHSKLISRLILCSTPLYMKEELAINSPYTPADKRINNAYFKTYQALLRKPELLLKGAAQLIRIAGNDTSFRLDQSTWTAFSRSLVNTIENQKTMQQLQTLTLPIDIIYGRYDILLISRYLRRFEQRPNIRVSSLAAGHDISKLYARKLATILQIPTQTN